MDKDPGNERIVRTTIAEEGITVEESEKLGHTSAHVNVGPYYLSVGTALSNDQKEVCIWPAGDSHAEEEPLVTITFRGENKDVVEIAQTFLHRLQAYIASTDPGKGELEDFLTQDDENKVPLSET